MLDKFKRAFARHRASGMAALQPRTGRALLLWRAAIGVTVVLILFAVVGFFAVPPIARYHLAKELTKQLGRQVTPEEPRRFSLNNVQIV
jgi:hypothetical protein